MDKHIYIHVLWELERSKELNTQNNKKFNAFLSCFGLATKMKTAR